MNTVLYYSGVVQSLWPGLALILGILLAGKVLLWAVRLFNGTL